MYHISVWIIKYLALVLCTVANSNCMIQKRKTIRYKINNILNTDIVNHKGLADVMLMLSTLSMAVGFYLHPNISAEILAEILGFLKERS